MKLLIKFACRRNLIYILQYFIWNLSRTLLVMFIDWIFKFNKSFLFTQLMFLGELLGGVIMYYSQKKYNEKKGKENKDKYFMSIKLITSEEDVNDYFVPLDGKTKILFLIFLISFMDVVEFMICYSYIPRFFGVSKSLCPRLNGISTMFALIFYIYALKLPVYKHHKFSLIIISICLFTVIVTEFIFNKNDIFKSHINLSITIFYILISQIFVAYMHSIEKYLFEYDYMNPFIVLIYEGLFGLFLSFLLLLNHNYFYDVVPIYKKKSTGEFVLFIFFLILFIIFSGGKNLFRVVTTKLFSPMVTTLQDYVLNPIYLLYYWGFHEDFKKGENIDIPYFVVNIIISLIISFFGCVYNEFIILLFCGLEHDTHDQISQRAIVKLGDTPTELFKVDTSSECTKRVDTN